MRQDRNQLTTSGLAATLHRYDAVSVLTLFLLAFTVGFVFQTRATPATSLKDTMNTQATGSTATHGLQLTLSGGNTFAAGEKVLFDFPQTSGFSQGGTWTTADFSFNDGSPRVIAGVNAGAGASTVSCIDGTNNIGIAIDTTALIFRVIPCGGSYVASPSGATILFVIGGDAPNGTLTNPSVAGSYRIDVTDAAGDCTVSGESCSVAVAIADSPSVGVTATIGSACGNGVVDSGESCDDGNTVSGDGCSNTCQVEGGNTPPPPPPDTTPPVISGVQAVSVTASGATVQWNTDEVANSTVDYGLTQSYGSINFDAGYSTNHSRALTGLSSGTTYHFRVCSTDIASNQACSSDGTFVTLDTTPPVISGVTVTGVTTTSATISWTTDEASSSFVDYGTAGGPPYATTAGAALPLVTSHSVTLTGLVQAPAYHFRVRSGDASGNESFTTDATFSTLDTVPPVISAVLTSNITPTSVRVTWTTDESSDSTVQYGPTVSYGSSAAAPTAVTSHQIDLSGLTPVTTYHFRVVSKDAAGNEADSSDGTFVTTQPPTPVISSVQAGSITETSARITWTTDLPSGSVVEYGTVTGPPYASTATGADTVTSHLVVVSGLTQGTTYHFRVRSTDAYSQTASTTDATFVTVADTTPPANVSGFDATAGDAQVALRWTNPSDADFASVKVVRKTGGYPTNPGDGTQRYAGAGSSFTDTGLVNGTTYYYAVFAFDGAGNGASGALANATPVAPVDVTPPAAVSGLTANAGDSQVLLFWTNPSDADWAGTRVVRKEGSDPTGPNDGTIAFDGANDNRLDTNVTNGTEYHYGVYAYDTSGNFSSGKFASATPQAGAPTPVGPSCTDSDGGRNYDTFGTVSTSDGSVDDTCDGGTSVIEQYCEAGARKSETHDCGSGFRCSGGRCVPQDFVPGEVCGNGSCAGGENSSSCPSDCPVVSTTPSVAVPVSTVTQDIKLSPDSMRFLATAAKIPLRLEQETVHVFASMTFTVKLPDESIPKPIKHAYVNYDGSSYVMRQTASYEAVVTASKDLGTKDLSIVVEYEDGTKDSTQLSITTGNHGVVYEDVNGQESPLAGARVTLLVDTGAGNFGLWNGTASGQTNPYQVDASGKYGFVVPPGTYKLVAEKDGYRTKETLPFPVGSENVIDQHLKLLRLPPKIQSIGDVGVAAGYVANIVGDTVTEVVQNPFVKQDAKTAAPIAAVAAAANVASAGAATATAIPYILSLFELLAHPLQLVARRRRARWGMVYNAYTKLPIDLAIVRLLDSTTGRILRSSVTDKIGRYFFITAPGKYRIVVVKGSYVFPSVALAGFNEDGRLLDIYHGEPIDVRGDVAITANIPLDPSGAAKPPRRIVLEGIGRRLQTALGIFSIAVAAAAAIISPTPAVLALLAGNVVLFLLFRRLAIPPRPKQWGIVRDETTGKPLRNAVARIFDKRFNKLLETQVTDVRGRYGFLVGSNDYYAVFEKQGYQKHQRDLTEHMEKGDVGAPAQVVSVDVNLRPVGTGGGTVQQPPMSIAASQVPTVSLSKPSVLVAPVLLPPTSSPPTPPPTPIAPPPPAPPPT